ncbi:iron-dicitrate ABC transporter permease FecC [Muribacter muris]|uniref:Iron-dicitrate ABC transporter permease FecC n=1 Tax=Muribacter muris TaxID=67855 RepID=A0A4Y9K939_9PAST|nr:iron-dicitrate ABC transporter permease FecC [Muribacter muris]MBF0784071.1 iron-dicitrate ABC transporter permease FecC [Muribacter muris]MBF0827566.1 iron-dicitrate ABC transporter permease FecC [Muribacter muris]TFV13126.1 iron-dicitrate ABC transporter permease FecC [Muribacter muris]
MTFLLRWAFPIIVLLLLIWGSLFLYYPTPISALESLSIFGQEADEIVQITVFDLRLPRALTAAVMGANLAVAGALLQTITRNPLASPSLLSVNAGASLAMVIATAVLPASFRHYSIALIASLGGGLSWLLVMMISGGWRLNANRQRVILAGIAVSLFCTALTKLVIIIAEDHAANIMNWLAGGLAHVRWGEWQVAFPFFLLTALFSLLFASRLNLLHLSDESAQTLGVNLSLIRWLSNIVALLIVGSSVSIAGPIAFIGLLIPHLARYWIGYDLRKALPITMLFGASLMLFADIVARAVNFPSEIPAGAILALLGAPIFILFARGKQI